MNNPGLYDIAIIGGGLAGLSLAIQNADAGFKVVLFEKEEYPFHKVCGEYVSLESWNFLRRLGVRLDEFNLPKITTLLLSDSVGRSYTFKLPLGGFGISRFTLDYELYKVAISKSVRVFTNSKVNNVVFNNGKFVVTSSTGETMAKLVAGSYGKRSNLDIKWSRSFTRQKNKALNNYIGIKYHIRFSHRKDQIALHNFYNGYCGISKIENEKSCLCYLTTADNLKKCGNSIKQMEQEILFKNPNLKGIFSDCEHLYDQPLAISQISFDKKTQVENGVLMLGDAAGMISPLCGNGMSMAMHSSKMAFEATRGFFEGDFTRQQMDKNYAETWKREFSKRLGIGRVVQTLFGGNQTTALFLKTMNLFPAVAEQVIKLTHGKPF